MSVFLRILRVYLRYMRDTFAIYLEYRCVYVFRPDTPQFTCEYTTQYIYSAPAGRIHLEYDGIQFAMRKNTCIPRRPAGYPKNTSEYS